MCLRYPRGIDYCSFSSVARMKQSQRIYFFPNIFDKISIHDKVYRSYHNPRLVGTSADTFNVMFGRNSCKTFERKLPDSLSVKCSCHTIPLCLSYAGKKIQEKLEYTIKIIYNHFREVVVVHYTLAKKVNGTV